MKKQILRNEKKNGKIKRVKKNLQKNLKRSEIEAEEIDSPKILPNQRRESNPFHQQSNQSMDGVHQRMERPRLTSLMPTNPTLWACSW